MEKRMNMKGTVTPLSSVLPPEEARKAANKVTEAIGEKEGQLNHLNHFVADNANLINIVKRLPDELHHDIMVPFGKAAFFPGRLIHTNEFLVTPNFGIRELVAFKTAITLKLVKNVDAISLRSCNDIDEIGCTIT